jgi:hypothetical protein
MGDRLVTNAEEIEKGRQAIMRFRELLDLMRAQLDEGEQAYGLLFANCSPEEIATLKEKDLQGKAAIDLIANPSTLGKAALHLRRAVRDFERDFEELYDNIMIH